MKVLKWLLLALAILLFVPTCGAVVAVALLGDDDDSASVSAERSPVEDDTEEPEPEPETKPTPKPESKPEPEPEPTGVDPKAVLATFKENLGGQPIKSMCDAAYTHWACFYRGVEALEPNGIRVNLSTDGGWTDDELDEMADRAGLHWFNFVGTEHEDLDVVVVNVNGIDHNTFRFNVPLLN